jgi:trehalose 6-phosphate phosphatase
VRTHPHAPPPIDARLAHDAEPGSAVEPQMGRQRLPPVPETLRRYADWALFLDLDGTLLEICRTPGAVRAPRTLPRLIATLVDAFGGAVAVLSGRTIEDIDRLLAPLALPAAAVHGMYLRGADGKLRELAASDGAFLDGARRELTAFVASCPGALLEDKGIALALHTRLAPEARANAQAAVARLAAASRGRYVVQAGKAVDELLPAGADKGASLLRFLDEPPFRGRRPLVLGDDRTDEHAFRAARSRDGFAIAIGQQLDNASMVLRNPADCRRWLARLGAARPQDA